MAANTLPIHTYMNEEVCVPVQPINITQNCDYFPQRQWNIDRNYDNDGILEKLFK